MPHSSCLPHVPRLTMAAVLILWPHSLRHHLRQVRTALLSPDGALLLAGGVSGALVGWRLDDGALACTFDDAGAAVSCACISGHEMLVGTQEGDVVGYALDPAVLYAAARCATWRRGPTHPSSASASPSACGS